MCRASSAPEVKPLFHRSQKTVAERRQEADGVLHFMVVFTLGVSPGQLPTAAGQTLDCQPFFQEFP